MHANGVETVPCFFNDSYLLVEINELNQLFLQNFLSANNLFDENMLEQVEHIWSQLKILNQTSVGMRRKRWTRRRRSAKNFHLKCIWLCTICVNIYYSQRLHEHSSSHTHLQMKSLKLSDQSSGWWRVGGGFLLKEGMEKINGKIRLDGIFAGGAGEQKADGAEWNDGAKS